MDHRSWSPRSRPVLEVIDEALPTSRAGGGRKLVILGDPGSGKSSLVRYLALRWALIDEATVRDTQSIPLVIELGAYGRWRCDGRKDFVRYLEEAPIWHEWPAGLIERLLEQPGRVMLLLDGLDEVFEPTRREEVINDITRFSDQFPHTPVLVTSRTVGYLPQRLRDADYRHFMLHDLDPAQITAFVDRWHEMTFDDPAQAAPKRDRLHKAIHDSKSIATHMQSAPSGLKGNLIDGETLTRLIEQYLQEELHFPQARAAARAVVEHLRQRNFILCFVGGDSYAFVHRTFLEYYCATDLGHRFNIAKTLDLDGLIALFNRHCRDDEWHEVLRLVCGQIDEAFIGKIVESLIAGAKLDAWDGQTAIPELPMAIWSLSEARTPARLESVGARLLEQVIECARKSYDLNYSSFTRQQLLPACKELGERWPGRQHLARYKEKILDGIPKDSAGPSLWPHFMAHIWGDRDAVVWLALTFKGPYRGAFYRYTALEALADKWPDQATRDFLTLRAVQEESERIRCLIESLAEKLSEPKSDNQT